MSRADPVVIVGAARTPMGGFQGDLAPVPAPKLGAAAIDGALGDAGVTSHDPQEIIMGCVLPAGQGQAPARQAAFGAGLPESAGCTTINKMCGSGMKAAMLAHDLLVAGTNDVMVAGGMESMSNAPYLLEKARSGYRMESMSNAPYLLEKARAGYRMGHGRVLDHMFTDGLEDPFGHGGLMGTFAEDCAQHYQFTREAQDEFAITSLTRAQKAIADGTFDAETVPVTVSTRAGETLVTHDEQPGKANLEKIPKLRPAFREGGTVTPANSSSISDGAAALVMMRLSEAERRGLRVRARIEGHATHSQDPSWFTTAPIGAVAKLLERLSWKAGDVDLFEINEAFAVVTMAAMRDLELAHDKVNVHGGACALGHPVGASGARILVTLLAALEKYDLRRGVAALCIGGGEATAMGIERLS